MVSGEPECPVEDFALSLHEICGGGWFLCVRWRTVNQICWNAGFPSIHSEERRKSGRLLDGCAVSESNSGQMLVPITLVLSDEFGQHAVHCGVKSVYVPVRGGFVRGGADFVDRQ